MTGQAKGTALFEISWEVCNKVGGIHTVLSTKAKALVERYGDDYVAIGPHTSSNIESAFREIEGYESFVERCRSAGFPVHVGRWLIPGEPLALLIDFSQLYERKDDILSELWEDYGVDSISGEWDYIEPVLFGYAASHVIELWWEEFLAPQHRRAIVHAHEWMTGSALLYIKKHLPTLGTVFTTHATVLGRSLSSLGHSPEDGLGDETPSSLAETYNVAAKHSIEGVVARQCDVFTTVSEITAREAELLHERDPDLLTPNGLDLAVLDELAGEQTRDEVRELVRAEAAGFLGENIDDCALVCSSGRYEFVNKGLDVLLEACAELDRREGRRMVLFLFVPAGNSGIRSEVLDRRTMDSDLIDGSLGICTHNLFDEEGDPIHEHCARLELTNDRDRRVRIIHVPLYLTEDDGFWNLPYEAVLRAMDYSVFPSYYEPWGYTPQESLALGVPTLTTDFAGFGRWAMEHELGPESGVTVLPRQHMQREKIVAELVDTLDRELALDDGERVSTSTCRTTAELTSWSGFLAKYDAAFALATERIDERSQSGVPQPRKPRLRIPGGERAASPKPKLRTFTVSATLPHELEPLRRLAQNYWWCWDPDAARLFEDLSPRRWKSVGHNPVALLQRAFAEDLETKRLDQPYLERLGATVERLEQYLASAPADWPCLAADGSKSPHRITKERPVAYFSAEFGIHESLRIYSGGLGILAGDHLKSASDIGLPLVAVGLFYRRGYTAQSVTPEGEQLDLDKETDPSELALEEVLDETGKPLRITLGLPGRTLHLCAWLARVGRVPLYLLDSFLPENREEDRDITRKLYGGDEEMRLKQEIVLGRGGILLLHRLGIQPAAHHINEGHAAFLNLERVRHLTQDEGLTFEEARVLIRATTLFTTHTPVPAGHDRFHEDLIRPYFADAEKSVGVSWERLFSFGSTGTPSDMFNMTYLALSFASSVNAVSRMHAEVSKDLLSPFWPGLLPNEVPLRGVTNGIHLSSWTDPGLRNLFGAAHRSLEGEDFSRQAESVSGADLWRIRCEAKERMLRHLSSAIEKRFTESSDSPLLMGRMLDGLDSDALWIGFARRFAPYKRAHILFNDPDEIARILCNTDRPVRIVIAGKAHPRDEAGKGILKSIVELSRRDDFVGKVFFVEDYDIELGRALVQGVDVWLNTPTRGLEASGTSGMKASANGGLNVSVSDGWWAEGFAEDNGWRIASEERAFAEQDLQDQLDSTSLYRLLTDEIQPLFFERGPDGVPTGWLERVRSNLRTIPPFFNTDRMVREYADEFYSRLAHATFELTADRRHGAKKLAKSNARIRKRFGALNVIEATIADLTNAKVGDRIDASVELERGELSDNDLLVELVYGHSKGDDRLVTSSIEPLRPVSSDGSRTVFAGTFEIERAGQYAYGIRVRANPKITSDDLLRDLILWV